MVRSMTGFGRAEASGESIAVTVEARSVNHRHLDVALRLPRAFAALELEARRLVQSRLERGRVDVNVQLTPLGGGAAQRVQVDAALAREYVARARALALELGLEGAPNLAWVLEQPGVVRLEEPEPVEPAVPWPLLAEALGRALDELVARRTAEGDRLAEALRTLHAELTTTVELIAARAPATTASSARPTSRGSSSSRASCGSRSRSPSSPRCRGRCWPRRSAARWTSWWRGAPPKATAWPRRCAPCTPS